MAKKKMSQLNSREEAIENLICAAIRVCYPCQQLSWDESRSLIETRLILDLRLALKDLRKFD